MRATRAVLVGFAIVAVLVATASGARAEDGEAKKAGELVAQGRYAEALQAADALIEAGDGREIVKRHRARALLGLSRALRIEQSHGAAMEFLEPHLDHDFIVWGYAKAALAAGREEHAAHELRRRGVGKWHEINLLRYRGHWDEALERARTYGAQGWADAAGWIKALKSAIDERNRLLARGRRAWTVTLVALAICAAGALALWRFAPAAAPQA